MSIEQSQRLQRWSLWIDAICINQSDPQERARQVSIMDEIYARCRSVIAWLGLPDYEDGDQESWVLRGNLMFAESLPGNAGDDIHRQAGIDRHRELGNPFARDPDAPASAYRFCSSIVSRPWFERRWVIQEMALAPTGYFMLGSTLTHRPYFGAMLESMGSTKDSYFTARRQSPRPPISFPRLCLRHDRAKCSDPRDRVYALRSMAKKGSFPWTTRIACTRRILR